MYKINFSLMHLHKYSLTELENMFPFEREIYLVLLNQHLEKEKQAQEQAKAQKEAEMRKLIGKARKR